MIDKILEKFGLTYDDLEESEIETLNLQLSALEKNQLTIPKVKDNISAMKIAVGSGSITPTGALSTVRTIFQSAGQGAITPVGALGRKIAISVGSGSITAIGGLGRKIKVAVGGGSITPVGSLITNLIKFITALLSHRQNLNVKLEAKQNLLAYLVTIDNLGVVLKDKPQLRTELLAKSNLNVRMEAR